MNFPDWTGRTVACIASGPSLTAADPKHVIATHRTGERWGDQAFIAERVGGRLACWQDAVPGQVVSYKAHGRTPAARVVCFHGKPRPADIGWTV